MCSSYLLFLVQIIILLRLANTMVEPRRLNSATSWGKKQIYIGNIGSWNMYLKTYPVLKNLGLSGGFLERESKKGQFSREGTVPGECNK